MSKLIEGRETDMAPTSAQPAYRPSTRRRVKPGAILHLLALIVLAVLFLSPVLWLLSIALKRPADLTSYPISILPPDPQWGNFRSALSMPSFDFWNSAWNSTRLSLEFSVLTVLSSAMVGFGFARLKGVGKNFVFLLMLATLMLPQLITTIPTYLLFSKVGLTESDKPWILWGLGASPFIAFLFRQFFSSIPIDLEEAALIDGCGYIRIFWQIFLPLSKAVMAVGFLLSFQGVWNDYFTPSLFLQFDKLTLAVQVATAYVDPQGNQIPTLQAAGALLYALPVIVIFVLLQRFFVQGIVTTGMKG